MKPTKRFSGTKDNDSKSISNASFSCRCFVWFQKNGFRVSKIQNVTVFGLYHTVCIIDFTLTIKNPMSEWRQKNYLVSHPVIHSSWNRNFPIMNDRDGFCIQLKFASKTTCIVMLMTSSWLQFLDVGDRVSILVTSFEYRFGDQNGQNCHQQISSTSM